MMIMMPSPLFRNTIRTVCLLFVGGVVFLTAQEVQGQQQSDECPLEPMETGTKCSVSLMGGKCMYPDMKDSTNCSWQCRCNGEEFVCSYREQAGVAMKDSPSHECSRIAVDTPARQCNHL
mmetsp:Transcript_9056/g.8803  ORF Transcript_9056/g.8803 Transcript_9056/m.8803 type:complete len:120 (-) Transcript_9056:327-686(-)